jgi:tight adherence protein B
MVTLAACLAAVAAWLGVDRLRSDPARWTGGRDAVVLGAGASVHQRPGRWVRTVSRRRAGPRGAHSGSLEVHVRALRQLASLLRSGRPPADAWRLLEAATPGGAGGATGRSGERTGGYRVEPEGRGPRPAARGTARASGLGRVVRPRSGGGTDVGELAARDVAAACRALAAAHSMGARPSSGLERHLGSCRAEFGIVWVRVVWCIRLSEGTGAALAELLGRLAGQLEARDDRNRALETALAGPRATQRMLGWLPVFGIGLAQLLGAHPIGVLLGTPVGRACLIAGTALWLANRVWSARLLRAARGEGL